MVRVERNCPNASVPCRAGTVYPRRGEFSLGVDITDIGKLWAARSVVRVITDASFQVAEAFGKGDLLGVIDALTRQHQYTMFVKRGLKMALVACADGISQINAACFRRKGWGQAAMVIAILRSPLKLCSVGDFRGVSGDGRV